MEKTKYALLIIATIFCLLFTLGMLIAMCKMVAKINQPSVAVENQDVCFRIKLADLEEILKAEEEESPRT